MDVDFPIFLAGLTVFAIMVAWGAASVITRLGARNGSPTKSSGSTPTRPPAPFRGRVWVLDGDTIRVGKHRVRLFGMDAPELDQRGGAKSKSNLIRLAGGADVKVEPLTMDCYGRVVAKVWRGDADLSERMVRDGYAVATSRWNRDYVPAERDARAARRGLWAFDQTDGIGDPSAHRAAYRSRGTGGPPGSRGLGTAPRRPSR
jgi:endonuclease YncB( thermonuclease family)